MLKIPYEVGHIYHLYTDLHGIIDALVTEDSFGQIVFITRFGDFLLEDMLLPLKIIKESPLNNGEKKIKSLPSEGWYREPGQTKTELVV